MGMAAALFSPTGKPAITLAVPSIRFAVPSLLSPMPLAPGPGVLKATATLEAAWRNLPLLPLSCSGIWSLSSVSLCWITKWRGRHRERGRKKDALPRAWFCSTWWAQPEEGEGAFGAPTLGDIPGHRYTAAPEARWIDCVWHGECQKHCTALPSRRSSASFGLGEPGGRKWEGWLQSDSSAHLSTSELEKSRGRYLASQGAAQEPHQISGQQNYSRSRQRALSSRQWHCWGCWQGAPRCSGPSAGSKADWMPTASPPSTQANKQILKKLCILLQTSSPSSFFCPSYLPFPESARLRAPSYGTRA